MCNKPFAVERAGTKPHINNKRLLAGGKRLPVRLTAILARMTGNQLDGLREVTVSQWDAGIGSAAGGSGNSRDDLKANSI